MFNHVLCLRPPNLVHRHSESVRSESTGFLQESAHPILHAAVDGSWASIQGQEGELRQETKAASWWQGSR